MSPDHTLYSVDLHLTAPGKNGRYPCGYFQHIAECFRGHGFVFAFYFGDHAVRALAGTIVCYEYPRAERLGFIDVG
jgi:hypothetical protein